MGAWGLQATKTAEDAKRDAVWKSQLIKRHQARARPPARPRPHARTRARPASLRPP